MYLLYKYKLYKLYSLNTIKNKKEESQGPAHTPGARITQGHGHHEAGHGGHVGEERAQHEERESVQAVLASGQEHHKMLLRTVSKKRERIYPCWKNFPRCNETNLQRRTGLRDRTKRLKTPESNRGLIKGT